MQVDLAQQYPKLDEITRAIDGFLASQYPAYFGQNAVHPFRDLKISKVIHDSLWGTNGFDWRELAIIDSPILQRLRDIHQTGLAYFVYPCAHHMRFEHSLGVCVMASRVFDALQRQEEKKFQAIASEVSPGVDPLKVFAQWRAELRLAALLHDTGHSLYSHTSEVVYSDIPLLRNAADELNNLVGVSKGTGEVLSFCISRTSAIRGLLERIHDKVPDQAAEEVEVNLDNVSLLIIGRSKHPKLQFLGDIISSDLDADKLDYLLRDATAAGLPLRYDLERYLYTVRLSSKQLADGEDKLQNMYKIFGVEPGREAHKNEFGHPFYLSYSLQLLRQAASTIEQIIICKFMLFSYIYHHKKVRAAEGMLARLIHRRVRKWRVEGKDDASLITEFLRMTDHSLHSDLFDLDESDLDGYRQRIVNRWLPRAVIAFTPKTVCPDGAKLSAFMSELQKPERVKHLGEKFEFTLAARLIELRPELGKDAEAALTRAGVWFDAPKPPKFDKLEDLFVGDEKGQIALKTIFPISSWIQAYITYRYNIRIFSFSEYVEDVEVAARHACKVELEIDDQDFCNAITLSNSPNGNPIS
jgi:HD superfamily phosphohydrolase